MGTPDVTVPNSVREVKKVPTNAGVEVVQPIVEEMLRNRKTVRVLEAGCGSRSLVRVGPNAYVVGIDTSQEQLQRNPALNERILGDIQDFPVPPRSFDIVFCWDVLEHLPRPEKAIENLANAVCEDGIVVIGSPVPNSLKGLITKFTPYWSHVMIYKHLLGNPLAGKNGNNPFPVFMRFSMSPHSIRQFAYKNNFQIETFHTYEDIMQRNFRRKSWLVDLGYKTLGPLIKILSFGWVDCDGTDFVIVLRRSRALRAQVT
jgi:SAM-dependent methyltransferase